MDHPDEETLHRLADGELSPLEAEEVERHVTLCASCSAFTERLERLRRLVGRVPRTVAPPNDLWADLQAQLPRRAAMVPPLQVEPTRRASDRQQQGFWRRLPTWQLAAAASVVLAAALGYGGRLSRPGGAGATPDYGIVEQAPSTAQPLGVRTASGVATSLDARMAAEVMRELEARRHLLAPETLAKVEHNLQVINAAIAETQRTLAADPNNVHLEEMLDRSRRHQTEYIRTTLALATHE